MSPLQKRALRTALAVVAALHLAHCPSATWGPDTGCVQNTQNVGRLFPELVSDAGIVLVTIDEGTAGTVPTARYLAGYTPPPAGPLTLLPRLSIGECRCVRSDGQDCSADAGIGAGGGDTIGGSPIDCPPISIYGVNAHGARMKPDAGTAFPTCVFSEADCLEGERCIDTKCSAPVTLRFDTSQQKFVAAPPALQLDAGLGGAQLTIELGGPIAGPDGGQLHSTQCPAATTTAKLVAVQPTVLIEPDGGDSVPRTAPLTVRWEGNQAGFTLALLRGTFAGLQRTLVCRGLDNANALTISREVLESLEPGAAELELVRMNATSIVPLPIQGGALLSVSSRKRSLTLR